MECVCCTRLFSFVPLAFVLVNDLLFCFSLFVLEMRTILLLILFGICTCILCLLPCLTRCSFIDALSCIPTGVSEINYWTWFHCTPNKSVPTLRYTRRHLPSAVPWISEDRLLRCW